MSFRVYLLLTACATIICSIATAFVVYNLDPTEAGGLGLLFFYASLFLTVVGISSLINFLVRVLVIRNPSVMLRHAGQVFRQSFFVAVAVCIFFVLLSLRYFAWWNALLIIIFFTAIEGLVFTHRKYLNQ